MGTQKRSREKKTMNFELLDFPHNKRLFTEEKNKVPYISQWKFRTRTQCFRNNPYLYPSTHHNLPYPYPYSIFKKNPYPLYLRTTKSNFFRPPYLFYVSVHRYGCVDVHGIQPSTPSGLRTMSTWLFGVQVA